MSRRNKFILMILVSIVIVSFIIFYGRHFLFTDRHDSRSQEAVPTNPPSPVAVPSPEPIAYKHMDTTINGEMQKINILELDPGNRRLRVKPVLSYDRVFGYEMLSAMVDRHKAYAAVNSGFFYEYGQPSGMVVIDGRLITGATGKYPVFLIQEGRASLKEINTRLWLESDGKRIGVTHINTSGLPGEMIVYTPEFGDTNRVTQSNVSAVVEDNTVKSVERTTGSTRIPVKGLVISWMGPANGNDKNFPLKPGDAAELRSEPQLSKDAQAYECGSWIIKDGKIVIGSRDEWVGVLTNRDPRTAVGIKNDGKLVLMTVDGRQPGYSAGLTAKELGKVLLDYGIVNAAMLDGGASTEMIVKGKIVNKPSFKGQERPLAGGIIVELKDLDKD